MDLSGIVDVEGLRSTAGDYLVRLGTVGADGSWPAAGGGLYGATFATEAESLVWYPRAAFERAGYAVPRTWDELTKLADQMVDDGHTPWCLGVEAGTESGASAVGFVEDVLLHAAGPDVYDRWASGEWGFTPYSVRAAFFEFGSLAFRDGFVLGGVASAIVTPQDLAAWPMFVDPPACWLHLAGGTDRLSWPAGGSATLAAFPFPAADLAYSDAIRGRAFTVVVFHDRPEVRRFLGGLLGHEFAAAAATSLVPAGIWPVGSVAPAIRLDDVARMEGELLRSALRAGTFRVAASELMPTRVVTAFEQGMMHYLTWGQMSLNQVLDDIRDSWQQTK